MVSKDSIKSKFKKVCINSYSSHDIKIRLIKDKNTGELKEEIEDNGLMLYRHPDLYKWSREAYEKGEYFFYCDREDPNNSFSKLKLCEPRYEYKLVEGLTEEEFGTLFK